jgi:DNA-binding transcriptional ArsR family regulator
MTDVLERVERLERLLGVDDGDGWESRSEPHPKTRPILMRPGREFGDWMKAQYRPGHIHVALGVKSEQVGWNTSVRRGASKPVKRRELGAAAALCQALSSETRLAILNELTLGQRTTAELMESVEIDRGQLYHHLRDLFVQGLVEQPERGKYAATSRGLIAFLVASVLPSAGDPAERARVLDIPGLEEDRPEA